MKTAIEWGDKVNRTVVYHGTETAFDRFDPSHCGRMTGCPVLGFWFSSDRSAADFYHSGAECGGRVIAARLNMENPLEVSAEEFAANWPRGPVWWAQGAYVAGHDGVIFRGIVDGDTRADVFAVFDADQIFILSPDIDRQPLPLRTAAA